MRLNTFTGTAVILGKDRHVSVTHGEDRQIMRGSGISSPAHLHLLVEGFTDVAEVEEAVALLEQKSARTKVGAAPVAPAPKPAVSSAPSPVSPAPAPPPVTEPTPPKPPKRTRAAAPPPEPEPNGSASNGANGTAGVEVEVEGIDLGLLSKAERLIDVLTHLQEHGHHSREQLVAACEKLKPSVPLLGRIEDIPGRIERALETLAR